MTPSVTGFPPNVSRRVYVEVTPRDERRRRKRWIFNLRGQLPVGELSWGRTDLAEEDSGEEEGDKSGQVNTSRFPS